MTRVQYLLAAVLCIASMAPAHANPALDDRYAPAFLASCVSAPGDGTPGQRRLHCACILSALAQAYLSYPDFLTLIPEYRITKLIRLAQKYPNLHHYTEPCWR